MNDRSDARPDEEIEARSSGDAAAWAVLGAASREKADAFLEKQGSLAELQAKELNHELMLRHWSLRVRHVSDILKLGFELAVAFIVLMLAVGFGAVIWQAAHAGGLVIEAFNVPAPMAEKGLTGQVISDKLLDRLTVMQNSTDSVRAASSFSNDWKNDIKVQIADTGVSLGDAVRFLYNWLGHEMHLSGELYQTPSGYALTVRTDNDPGQTFDGKPGDLNSVIQQAAEAVFARAQPYRYGVYLFDHGRFAEAFVVYHKLAEQGPRNETAWADVGLSLLMAAKGDDAAARESHADGVRANPELPNLYDSLLLLDGPEGHDEAVLSDTRRAMALLNGGRAREANPSVIPSWLQADRSVEASLLGDYQSALANDAFEPGSGGESFVSVTSARYAVQLHDGALARKYFAQLRKAVQAGDSQSLWDEAATGTLMSFQAQDWRASIARADDAIALDRKFQAETNGWINARLALRTAVMPFLAYAYAVQGKFDAADDIFKSLPLDCDLCLRYRGKVEALRKNWSEAVRWFAVVAARSPSIPFADTDWGEMLLKKGDYDGAIAKFESARAKGPHFADPLEMWGEALMEESRSDLALAKFEEANKYAPNWGRLHLEWGKALFWSGDKAGAQRQFAIATHLDLSAADKAALTILR